MINKAHLYLYIIFILFHMNISTGSKDITVFPHYSCKRERGHVKRNVILNSNNITATEKHINMSTATPKPFKKWQVGRVSRKQYEIINMLWRKTKLFGDIESSPTPHSVKFSSPNPVIQSSTVSYIEFYYLDEINDRIKRPDGTTSKTPFPKHFHDSRGYFNGLSNNFKFVVPNAPIFAFHINDPNYKRTPGTSFLGKVTTRSQIKSKRPRLPALNMEESPMVKDPVTKTSITKTTTNLDGKLTNKDPNADVFINSEKCPITVSPPLESTENNNKFNSPSSSTIYDKKKFFEMYDQNTHRPSYRTKYKNLESREFIDETDYNQVINTEKKVLLNHVDQIGNNHDQHHKTKYVKKHIIESFHSVESQNNINDTNPRSPELHFSVETPSISSKSTQADIKPNGTSASYEITSKTALWSEYSFSAVYIHEAAQVHCDAAGISPHWLVAAGSCLSRHQKNPTGQGRSAFVAYCGSNWWRPERVAYVKYSIVHPRFNHRDKIRKHLYNIGVIEVVSSMASACTGWAPISLMSHQFAAEQDGSIAVAVGWGLDRFGTQYASTDLPKWPLKQYKALIFSNSCPGSISYSKTKRPDKREVVTNVYCLSLPPYSGEETDPVHGSLLLAGGKLIALYLQEERRPWGEQSAQYTGTWRLTPWVLNLAKEPDDGDSFSFDIK